MEEIMGSCVGVDIRRLLDVSAASSPVSQSHDPDSRPVQFPFFVGELVHELPYQLEPLPANLKERLEIAH